MLPRPFREVARPLEFDGQADARANDQPRLVGIVFVDRVAVGGHERMFAYISAGLACGRVRIHPRP